MTLVPGYFDCASNSTPPASTHVILLEYNAN